MNDQFNNINFTNFTEAESRAFLKERQREYNNANDYFVNKHERFIKVLEENYKHYKKRPLDNSLKRMFARCIQNVYDEKLSVGRFMSTGTSADIEYTNTVLMLLMATLPGTVFLDLVIAKAMDRESMDYYFLQMVADITKGDITQGNILLDPLNGWRKTQLAFENVNNEIIATGTGVATNFTGNFAYPKFRLNSTVTVTDGVEIFTGTYTGTDIVTLVGDQGGSGTVQSSDGAFDIDFNTAPVLDVNIFASYVVNTELNPSATGKIKFIVVKQNLVASKKTIGASFTIDDFQRLMKSHQMNMDDLVVQRLAAEMIKEIDSYVLLELYNNAGDTGSITFDATKPDNITKIEHYNDIKVKLASQSSIIEDSTQLVRGGYLICGTNVGVLLQSVTNFVKESTFDVKGPYKLGKLDDYTVYVNREYPINNWLMGAYGSMLEPGTVYAPYIPVLVTDYLTTPSKMEKEIASMTWDALKVINPDYYSVGVITNF